LSEVGGAIAENLAAAYDNAADTDDADELTKPSDAVIHLVYAGILDEAEQAAPDHQVRFDLCGRGVRKEQWI
jgi:hypothetical protein